MLAVICFPTSTYSMGSSKLMEEKKKNNLDQSGDSPCFKSTLKFQLSTRHSPDTTMVQLASSLLKIIPHLLLCPYTSNTPHWLKDSIQKEHKL